MVTKAIRSSFAGKKLLLTDEQAAKISETFGEKMQAKQIAKKLADGQEERSRPATSSWPRTARSPA